MLLGRKKKTKLNMDQTAFLGISCACCFEMMVLTVTVWNSNTKIYFWSMEVAAVSCLFFTAGIIILFFAPASDASNWTATIFINFGYWVYIPAEFTVMYTRLHLLRPSPRVMLLCKIILLAEWVLVTTPNAVLAGGAVVTTRYKFADAYSYSQRIEPALYAFVSLMLSSLYIYHAYIMFRRYADKRVRSLLIRLLYTNTFLLTLAVGSIVAEYVGGGILQTGYVAFVYAFVGYISYHNGMAFSANSPDSN